MNSIKVVLVLVLFLMGTGCVSLPNTPAFDLASGVKVGYEIELTETIAHTHYGTTVFNNFVKEREGVNWELNEYAKKEARRLLQSYGYVPVEITQEMTGSNDGGDTDTYEQALKLETEYRKKLADKFDIKAAIRLLAQENTVHMECGAYGCTEFTAANAGFFSRGLALLKPFLHVVLPSISHAYLTDPSVDIYTHSKEFAVSNSQLFRMKDFSPEDFKNMDDSDWLKVEQNLKKLITLKLKTKIMAIKAGSDGSGGLLRDVE